MLAMNYMSEEVNLLKRNIFLVLLVPLLIWGCSGGDGELKDLLPSSADVPGITEGGSPHIYTGDKLFDYMNGGAELYYEYGFERAGVQRYQTPPGEVTVEIYQMDLPANAYGIYTFDTAGEHPPIGQDATYEQGLLSFWKGRYFIRVFSDNADLKETILILGRAIAQKITEEGARPDIVAILPSGRVIEDSLLYFQGMLALNNSYFLSHQDVLALQGEAKGITFRYKTEAQPLRVIMVRYPGRLQAEEAFHALQTSGIIKEGVLKDGSFLGKSRKGYGGATVTGNHIVLALDGVNPQTVSRTLQSLPATGGQ
jgi:hypothetical protein